MYINSYWCDSCETCWADKWDFPCVDQCPVCNEITEPFNSENIEEINEGRDLLQREVS